MKQIRNLTPFSMVVLKLDGFEEPAQFIGLNEKGAKAVFRTFTPTGEFYDWEAYRFKGRWAYGTGAEKISLVSFTEPTMSDWSESRRFLMTPATIQKNEELHARSKEQAA